jgi:hypothetical protein
LKQEEYARMYGQRAVIPSRSISYPIYAAATTRGTL